MSIQEQLKQWAEKNNGSSDIKVSIHIHNNDMDISVVGDSVESAYNKIKDVISIEDTKHQEPPTPTEVPKPTATSGTAIKYDSVTDIKNILNGRQLVRIYNGIDPLNAGQELADINGIKYVVKGGVK